MNKKAAYIKNAVSQVNKNNRAANNSQVRFHLAAHPNPLDAGVHLYIRKEKPIDVMIYTASLQL